MYKGIIFDCDGVLVDTEGLFSSASNDHLKDLGIELTDNEKSFSGVRLYEYSKYIVEKYSLKMSVEQFVQDEQQYYKNYFIDSVLVPMPGLINFIIGLKKAGMKLAIASSSSKAYVEHMIELFKIENYFEVIVCGDEVSKSKPDPDIYLKAISKLGMSNNELIAIEDSKAGIASAKAAGLYVIAYKGSKIVQDTELADYEIDDYSAVNVDNLIKSIGKRRNR